MKRLRQFGTTGIFTRGDVAPVTKAMGVEAND
jgi:hypothetical protein